MRYLGASSFAFFMAAALSALSSLGGDVVRVAKGTPTCAKTSSCPAGTQRHSSRTVCLEALVNECGALAGMLMVSPARTTDFSPRKVASISPSRRVKGLLEIMPVGRRSTGGRDVYVD